MNGKEFLEQLIKDEELVATIYFDKEKKLWCYDMDSKAKSHLYIYPERNDLLINGRYDLNLRLKVTSYHQTIYKLLDIFVKDIMCGHTYCSECWLKCLERYDKVPIGY